MAINLNDMIYFVTTAETENLSQAAAKLGIRQPSLSQAIKKLEHDVNAKLFFRNSKGVHLTPAGQRLLVRAESFIAEWQDIQQSAFEGNNAISGIMRVGAHPSVAQNILSAHLPDFLNKHPDISLDLYHASSRDIVRMVIEYELDFGFAVNPAAHPDLIMTSLYTGHLAFWRAKDLTPCNDLQGGNPAILYDPEFARAETLLYQAGQDGIVFQRFVHSTNTDVLCQMAANGGGIVIAPEKDAKRSNRQLIKVDNLPSFSDDHYMIYRREKRSIGRIKAFSKHIRAAFV